MTLDKHTLALVSIVGSSLDVLGALYLAYDLLGGQHGPLRTLTRAVTYGALFGAGYGLGLGAPFGLAAGIAHGLTLGWEFARASRHAPKSGFWMDTAVSVIRGLGFAVGAAYLFGWRFGLTFGALSAAGQTIAYQLGIRPTADYRPGTRPRLTRFLILSALNRTAGYALTGYLSSLAARQRDQALAIGLRTGIVVGIVTAVVSALFPFIEWKADHIPERRLGLYGILLILAGFALQSIQYWLALMDVNVG